MRENKFCIDFFEMSFLVEACIPPRPIARTMLWHDVINKHYKTMTPDERGRLYEWIGRNGIFQEGLEKGNEDCILFRDRFNPKNQYKILVDGSVTPIDCFLHNGNYHIQENTFIPHDKIKSIEPA
jgi:hypothetical protein